MSEETKAAAKISGPRGELGVATAGLTIKQRWEESGKLVSLKQFARSLSKEGDQVAKDWMAHKKGSMNQKRTADNQKIATLAGAASRLARKSKKGDKSKKSDDTKVDKKAAKAIVAAGG